MDQWLLFAFGMVVFVISTLGTVGALVSVSRQHDEVGGSGDRVAQPDAQAPAPSLRIVRDEEVAA